MKLTKVQTWVQGVLELAACGAAHEIARNEELDVAFETEYLSPGVIMLTDEDHVRYLVRIEQLK